MSEIITCPYCGASVEDTSYEFCPYCGCVLIDQSEKRTQARIDETTAEKKSLLEQPKKLALIIASTLSVAAIALVIVIFTFLTNSASYNRATKKIDNYTQKMEKAYQEEDWDALYDMVILNCETYISSDYYYKYRTAWFLATYPKEFDDAYQKGDTEHMSFVYDIIKDDDAFRDQDSYLQFYKADAAIDKALHEEYLREKEIMDSLN